MQLQVLLRGFQMEFHLLIVLQHVNLQLTEALVAIAAPTNFNYTVTTIGSCASQTDSGIITVNPLSTISLSSAVSTTSQIGANGICMGDSIVDILYTYGGVRHHSQFQVYLMVSRHNLLVIQMK